MTTSPTAKRLGTLLIAAFAGLAIPASAFTFIELLDPPRPTAQSGAAAPAQKSTALPPTPPQGPSSVSTEPKAPQPIGLLVPAVQKVREAASATTTCPAGQVARADGAQGCQPADLRGMPHQNRAVDGLFKMDGIK